MTKGLVLARNKDAYKEYLRLNGLSEFQYSYVKGWYDIVGHRNVKVILLDDYYTNPIYKMDLAGTIQMYQNNGMVNVVHDTIENNKEEDVQHG